VKSQHVKAFSAAVDWFRLALKLNESTGAKDKVHQANILRLVANCYLSLNDLDTALSCVELANEVCGPFLRYNKASHL